MIIIKTYENASEVEYYEEILNFYEKKEKGEIRKEKVEKWEDFSYINLMHDIQRGKHLDDADIRDVAKNSIILILSLFEEKCQVTTEGNIDQLSDEEKEMIREALMKALE